MSDNRMAERANALNQQIGYALAILLSCLLVGFFTYQSGHNTGTSEASAAEYEQAAKRNARIACRNLASDAIADCVYDEIGSAIEQSESEQDLNAQQWMVWWAGVLTVITAITTMISWVALRYLRETFRETAKMAGKTEQATDAMVKANDIALQAQRPWLQIEVALREIVICGDWNSIYFEATVTNIGQMVAERCAVRLAIVNDDTTARGQRRIEETRAQVEEAAKGVVEQGRSPYPMLPRQSETYSLKRESMGLPWRTGSAEQEALRITMFVAVRYHLPGDDVMRETERGFCLTYLPPGSSRDDKMLPFGIPRPLPDDLSAETLWLRPAGHNRTT